MFDYDFASGYLVLQHNSTHAIPVGSVWVYLVVSLIDESNVNILYGSLVHYIDELEDSETNLQHVLIIYLLKRRIQEFGFLCKQVSGRLYWILSIDRFFNGIVTTIGLQASVKFGYEPKESRLGDNSILTHVVTDLLNEDQINSRFNHDVIFSWPWRSLFENCHLAALEWHDLDFCVAYSGVIFFEDVWWFKGLHLKERMSLSLEFNSAEKVPSGIINIK